MPHTQVQAHPLLTRLICHHHAQWLDFDNLAAWLAGQAGDHVLLFAGDPVAFPESLDVAVILPELQKVSAARHKPFGIAVAVPENAQALAETYGSRRWPTLMFFRDGQYVSTLSGMHDWTDYLDLLAQALDKPVSRPPTIGIPVVSANAAVSPCH
ncbi:thioredoxin domain-containing protein [Rhodoferax antarcticus]|uniref:hydrogenase n=1 Tax=Rhodoferax antarcticus TaxID=81479 RepID=UPI0022253869|nr:hydrogenase [Rhodoferax antarcticus]MCW2314122.1 hydrogenase-1 operon protein HyaE [Rhodoferax antarcticus]